MSAKSTTPQPLHKRLLDGFEVKSRQDGTVHSIKAQGKTVGEICVGKKSVRLNLRAEVKAPEGVELSGKSKSWPGGGLVVTDANLTAARALLTAATKTTAAPAK